MPTPIQVKEIFKDTYIFYTKWIAIKEPNWSELMDECRAIEHKYPFELCCNMLVGLVDIIEDYWKERNNGNG